jgi:methyl coenzyme M reductase subunit C
MGTVKEKLLAAAKLRTEVVEIDGVSVSVREISTEEFSKYGSLTTTDRPRATAHLIAACVIDGEGKPELTIEDAMRIVDSARVSMAIVNAVMRLSGFAEKEPDAN